MTDADRFDLVHDVGTLVGFDLHSLLDAPLGGYRVEYEVIEDGRMRFRQVAYSDWVVVE